MTPKVSFISSHAERGGSEKVLMTLIEHLPDYVHDVIVLRAGPSVDDLQATGARVQTLETGAGPWSLLRSARSLRRVLKAETADVIHANGVKAALVAALSRPKQPIVWWKHDFSWDGRVGNFVARKVALVVGVSEAVLEGITVDVDKQVIHPGVNVTPRETDTGARVKQELGLDAEARLVTLVGRIHPAKGHREALAIAGQLGSDVHLVFVGPRDPDQDRYGNEVSDEADGLPNVHVLGNRTDVLDIVAASDVVIVPSVRDERGMGREGFGLVAVEALSLGVPVIAYADGALPEVLGDAGKLLPAGDRDRLAAAIDEVLRMSTDELDALAARGIRRAADFSVEEMVRKTKEVYDRLATAGRSLG